MDTGEASNKNMLLAEADRRDLELRLAVLEDHLTNHAVVVGTNFSYPK